jgi:RNA polymerase sigma factor for flagellar operon FliA
MEYDNLVNLHAKKLRNTTVAAVEIEDLKQVGRIGLLEAVENYVRRRGSFNTFAHYRIRGAMLDYLRMNDWAGRTNRALLKLAEKLRLKALSDGKVAPQAALERAVRGRCKGKYAKHRLRLLDEGWNGGGFMSVDAMEQASLDRLECVKSEDVVDDGKKELLARVRKAMGLLPKRHREAIELYYFGGASQKKISVWMKMSESRVCQVCKEGIGMLKMLLAAPSQPPPNKFGCGTHYSKEI